MASSSRIQWGALGYEIRRIAFPRLYKMDRNDREWCAPIRTALGYTLAMLGLMLFLGTYLYWSTPMILIAAAGGPILIARNIWAERNPLLQDRPADFMAACGFSRETWHRASLLLGLLLSLGFGLLLSVCLVWLYRKNADLQPVDRNVILEVGALPMATALFFLLHLSLERSRRTRKTLSRGGEPSLVQRIRIFGGLEKLLWIPHLLFFGLLIVVFVRYTVYEVVLLGLFAFAVIAAAAAAGSAFKQSSVRHVHTAFVIAAFALFGSFFYVIEHMGTHLIPRFLAGLMDTVKPPAAALILIGLFLFAAGKANRLSLEDAPTAAEPDASEEAG